MLGSDEKLLLTGGNTFPPELHTNWLPVWGSPGAIADGRYLLATRRDEVTALYAAGRGRTSRVSPRFDR
jgi:hypothetical protein